MTVVGTRALYKPRHEAEEGASEPPYCCIVSQNGLGSTRRGPALSYPIRGTSILLSSLLLFSLSLSIARPLLSSTL